MRETRMSCMTRIIVSMLIASGLGFLLYRGCIRRNLTWGWRTGPEVGITPGVTTPSGWQPFGGTVAEPEVKEAPSTEYTAGSPITPVEPKKDPRNIFVVPPGTLGDGGDVRELIPSIELFGPEPGSAASEACDE